ncbi:Nudix family hydrolase [Thiohalobacter thiocyanaticus]|uniref:Nudix family hydrolase n=1 Tax=Thiohalobacter thiocyanaticus TaxID=585455 RepID=UPI001F4E69CB|nr:Nudix family hydrolase [Thiohalobacter thiocyanaticus]
MAVALAVIRDAQDRILVSRRHDQAHQGGLWELPGGKCEPGEPALDALRREIREELGIRVARAEPLIRIPYRYPDREVRLEVYEVRDWSGEPQGCEGQPLRWVSVNELDGLDFPAANGPILRALQLPARYLITPEPASAESFLAALERALAQGVTLVQLRMKQARPAALIEAAIELVHRHGARILLNTGSLTPPPDADGIHLTAAQLLTLKQRPLPADRWVGVSCHTPAELARAGELGLDFAVLGPVQTTRTHPDAAPLGWDGFAAACESAVLPVYALGGMTPADVGTARSHGGQGVAAIRGLWPEPVDEELQ